MLKKFLVAMMVVLLALSSQIASAEDVDWSQAPRISNHVELINYIESQQRNGFNKFHVVFVNGFRNENPDDFLMWKLVQHVNIQWQYQSDGTALMTYEIKEYPGTHVANAYLTGNTSWLTAEEKQLYNIAVGIVNEANQYQSEIDKELYIHNAICQNVWEYRNENERNKTAIGALIDHYAQCQGYTDAFYMLGRMCGLNVSRVQGTGDGELHVWNTIQFDNGKTYCVDVTFDDKNLFGKLNSYVYFNAPLEIMQMTHSYQWDMIPNLQERMDNYYSYRNFIECKQASTAEEGLQLIARKLSDGNNWWFSAMTPFDARFSEANVNQTANYIANASGKNINLNTWQRGNYLYFTAMTR